MSTGILEVKNNPKKQKKSRCIYNHTSSRREKVQSIILNNGQNLNGEKLEIFNITEQKEQEKWPERSKVILLPDDFPSSSFAPKPSCSGPHLCWCLICCPVGSLSQCVLVPADLVLLAIFEKVQWLDFMAKKHRGTNVNRSKLGHRLLGDHKFVAPTLTTACRLTALLKSAATEPLWPGREKHCRASKSNS